MCYNTHQWSAPVLAKQANPVVQTKIEGEERGFATTAALTEQHKNEGWVGALLNLRFPDGELIPYFKYDRLGLIKVIGA